MINWRARKTLKHARELAHAAAKLRRIHDDVLDPRRAAELAEGVAALRAAVAARDVSAIPGLSDRLDKQLAKALPRTPYAGLRENIEVFLVAAIVAMAVRTFFIQPFKIPTGSMQPTLYGIYPYRDEHRADPPLPYRNGRPSLPVEIFGAIVQGRIYEPGGYRARGDHIFVDKVSYHFRKPRRGEVIVFDTHGISDLHDPRGSFYIKRLIGLAGDTIQIQPPHLLVNGRILDDRTAFKRMYSLQNDYHGYVLAEPNWVYQRPYLAALEDAYQVPSKHLFVLGDNSRSSLDGRFWGGFPEENLVGRAVVVYWPFSERIGRID